jgi:two-component system cell cycle sensor histidine kinase/response regulator CckA
MPGLGGPELAKTGMELRPDLRVVYMSGYTDRTVDRTLIGPHAIFVQKPISLSVLAVKIRQLLDDRADPS